MIFYIFHEIDVKIFLKFFINNCPVNITTIYIYTHTHIYISKGTITNMKLVPSISIILKDDIHHVSIC